MVETILLDTSILIDFFRKEKKENSVFFELSTQHNFFSVSVITEYEIFVGSNLNQYPFWKQFFNKLTILPMDSAVLNEAVEIHKTLKSKSKLIEIPDILIAATAIKHGLILATINKKHFERIENLIIQ